MNQQLYDRKLLRKVIYVEYNDHCNQLHVKYVVFFEIWAIDPAEVYNSLNDL